MFYTKQQAAEMLGISTYRVEQLLKSGALPYLPVADNVSRKYYKIHGDAIREYKKKLSQIGVVSENKTTPIPDGFISTNEATILIGRKTDAGLHEMYKKGLVQKFKHEGRSYWRKADLVPKEKVVQSAVTASTDAITAPLTKFFERLHQIDSMDSQIADIRMRVYDLEQTVSFINNTLTTLLEQLGGLGK